MDHLSYINILNAGVQLHESEFSYPRRDQNDGDLNQVTHSPDIDNRICQNGILWHLGPKSA